MKYAIRTCLLALMMMLSFSVEARAEKLVKVDATAYTNPNNNLTYSGNPTVEGVTLGGKKEWIGERVILFYSDEDGSLGELYGCMEFQDTGNGRASRKYPGKTDIETGETIDIYMEDYDDCIEWGRQEMYVLFLDEVEMI